MIIIVRSKNESVVKAIINLFPFLFFFFGVFVWCHFSVVALQSFPFLTVVVAVIIVVTIVLVVVVLVL